VKRLPLIVVALVSAALVGAGAAWAASLLITPKKLTVFAYCIVRASNADSDVDQGSASNNFGTSSDLYVRSKAAGNRRAFVKFDLSSCNASTRDVVTTATLSLYMTGAPGTSRTYDVRRVNATWTETGITWTNQPAVGSVTSSTTTGTTSNVWRTWAVNADAQAWLAGTATNYGLRVSDATESAAASPEAKFAPKEWGTPGQSPRVGRRLPGPDRRFARPARHPPDRRRRRAARLHLPGRQPHHPRPLAGEAGVRARRGVAPRAERRARVHVPA
jgi:hypothetical protein